MIFVYQNFFLTTKKLYKMKTNITLTILILASVVVARNNEMVFTATSILSTLLILNLKFKLTQQRN